MLLCLNVTLLDPKFIDEPGGLLLLLLDGLLEIQHFVFEFPDLQFGLMLFFVDTGYLFLSLSFNLYKARSTSFSLLSSVWCRVTINFIYY